MRRRMRKAARCNSGGNAFDGARSTGIVVLVFLEVSVLNVNVEKNNLTILICASLSYAHEVRPCRFCGYQ
jgi:hypothetical protein